MTIVKKNGEFFILDHRSSNSANPSRLCKYFGPKGRQPFYYIQKAKMFPSEQSVFSVGYL